MFYYSLKINSPINYLFYNFYVLNSNVGNSYLGQNQSVTRVNSFPSEGKNHFFSEKQISNTRNNNVK